MRFLNVYPKRIWATLNAAGNFEGQFTFDLEQYGLMMKDMVCDVVVSEDLEMVGQWNIWLKPLFDVDMPHFDKFVSTLNHYVFDVLRYMPNRSAVGDQLPVVKIFFDAIYFDMSGLEPVVHKIPADLSKPL
jgi:hypothetical protein